MNLAVWRAFKYLLAEQFFAFCRCRKWDLVGFEIGWDREEVCVYLTLSEIGCHEMKTERRRSLPTQSP